MSLSDKQIDAWIRVPLQTPVGGPIERPRRTYSPVARDFLDWNRTRITAGRIGTDDTYICCKQCSVFHGVSAACTGGSYPVASNGRRAT
jgi:hypothetical protein